MIRCEFMVHKEAKYLFIVRVDVDPKDEERFNEWYNTEHIPTMTNVPGVLGASRYCSVDGSSPKYTAIYEWERGDIRTSKEWKKAADVSPWPKDMLLSNISYTVNKLITPEK
jgi:antibiotic biosynthesis monooxygenase (ABM) superfamily enzyme